MRFTRLLHRVNELSHSRKPYWVQLPHTTLQAPVAQSDRATAF